MCPALLLVFLLPYLMAGGLTAWLFQRLAAGNAAEDQESCLPCGIGLFWPATLPILLLWAGGRGLTRWRRRRTFPRARVVRK